MSGDYMCKVSTLQNEVSMTKKMTVFGIKTNKCNFSSGTKNTFLFCIPVPPRRVQIMHQKCSIDQVDLTF